MSLTKKRVLRWSIIWVIAFLVLALIPVVPFRKGKTVAGRIPLAIVYLAASPGGLLAGWPYVLGHVAVTTLIAAQVMAGRATPRDSTPPEQTTSSP